MARLTTMAITLSKEGSIAEAWPFLVVELPHGPCYRSGTSRMLASLSLDRDQPSMYPGQPRVPRALGGNYRQSLPKLFRRTKPSQGFIAETLRQANQLAWFC